MSYRDDRDADQARITALQADLEAAQRKIDDLEGRRSTALTVAKQSALATRPDQKTPWFGATRLERAASFEGELPRDDMEDLVEVIRALTGNHGRTELFKSSLTWFTTTAQGSIGPHLMISVVIKDGRTTVTATDQLKALAGGIYGGVGGGVGGGAILLPVLASIAVPVLAPVIFLGWIGGAVFGARALYLRASRKRAAGLQIVFDGVAAWIAAKLPPAV